MKANSDPPLVIINQIQPILVRFSVPQSQFPDIQRYYRGGNALLVRATPSEGSGATLTGTLAFVDNNVDSTTGTVLLKARFANPEGSLWPGQYTNVQLQLFVDPNALTLPAKAVMTGQQGTYVYTVDSAASAKQRPVQVARTVDSLSVISTGVERGRASDHRRSVEAGAGIEGHHQSGGPMTALFIRRPVMTALVMIGILFFGASAYKRLPVSDLPSVDFPDDSGQRQPSGSQPGNDGRRCCDSARKAVLDDRRHRQHDVVERTGLDVDHDSVLARPRALTLPPRMCRRRSRRRCAAFPQGILPPSYRKVNPADQPILYFALTSKTMPLSQLDEYGETFMAQRISMVPGIAQVQVYGGQKYAVRVQLDPTSLANRGIGIDEVTDAISSQNVSMPTGTLWGTSKASTIKANGQLQNAVQFRQMVVAYRNGAPVHLDELGNVLDDVENNKVASWYNGDRGVDTRNPATARNEYRRSRKGRERPARFTSRADPAERSRSTRCTTSLSQSRSQWTT